MLASRYQGRVPYNPQMAVSAYPSALQRLNPQALATPFAPQTPNAAPFAAPPMQAPQTFDAPMVGSYDTGGDGADVGGQASVASPNQSFGGMVDAGLSMASMFGGPFGGAALMGGMVAGADRGFTSPAIGPLSVMAQIAGLGTMGTALDSLMGGSEQASVQGQIGADTPQGLVDAMMATPQMNAGLIGGNGGMSSGGAQDFGDTSPNAFGGNTSMGGMFGGFGGFGGGGMGGGGPGMGGGESGPGTGGW